MDDARDEGGLVSHATVICGSHGLAPLQPDESSSPAEGRIVPFPHLLRMLANARAAGVLTIDRGTSIRSVFFQDGTIVWAESCDPGHRFSEWLPAAGLVAEEPIERARALVRAGVCRFGEALLRVGALSPCELGRAAERFVVELVTSAFSWREGRYQFSRFRSRGGFEPPVYVAEPVAVETVVLAGYRAMTDASLATLWLGDLGMSRVLAADPFRYVAEEAFTEAHAALLQRISTTTFTVAELVEEGPLEPVETLRLLGALDAIGVIVPV